ncbi:hypothetical protein ASL20_09665 [Cupriavidus necator]|nr:hypothetical protein ASL20_09665 [Cupriavidus necator]
MGRPYWTGPKAAGNAVGRFRPDFESELMIWRVIRAKWVSIDAVNEGRVDLIQLLKANAVLDAMEAAETAAIKEAQGKP